jgi:hypothetical protein
MSEGRRVTAGIVLAVVGALVFELCGAWLFARGLPWWTALAGALLAFPVVPLAWHLFGERKRRRRLATAAASAKPGVKAKPGTLTAGDRFTMRLVAVALMALGPLVFFRGGQVWRAFRDHPGWFVPQGPPSPRSVRGDARLIGQVPGDAELVMWGRKLHGIAGAAAGAAADEAKELLFAVRSGGDVLIVVRGSDKALGAIDVAELNAQLGKQRVLEVNGPLVARRRAADLMVVVSEGWAAAVDDRAAGRSDGPDAIVARLDVAPRDAVVIAAAAPAREVAGLALTGVQWWVRADQGGIRIDADFFVRDRLVATALMARMDAERRELAAAAPAQCRADVERLLREIVVVGGDTMVKASAYWSGERAGKAMMCGLGALMEGADRE